MLILFIHLLITHYDEQLNAKPFLLAVGGFK